MRTLPWLSLLVLVLAACSPARRGGRGGGSDDDDSVGDDDDAADDDDTMADDDDTMADDDDTMADDDDSTPTLPPTDGWQLLGRAWALDLTSGTFVEPPGVGPLLASQLGESQLLLGFADDSDFGPSAQPGLRVIGALSDPNSSWPQQDPCAATSALTAGDDGVEGTSDDVPGDWNSPWMEVGPTSMQLSSAGTAVPLDDLVITGAFSTDGGQITDVTFSGSVDTRSMAEALSPDGGPGAVCDLVQQTVGVNCVECGAPLPGAYCLDLEAIDLVADEIDGPLQTVTCADVIDLYYSGADCSVDRWDANGDGYYEGCPSW
jgi:hypothetical protein